jgi:hypothetical protein
MYRIKWFPIVASMLTGLIFLFMPFEDINEIPAHPFVFLFIMLLSFLFFSYSFYLLRKRKSGKGFYWDEDGIVIDLKGNKIFWDEIEDIQLFKSNITYMRSTVIYPHYTNHEKIRERHKKAMPSTAHSIDWILIKKPKEFHKNLMEAWKEKRNAE